MPGELGNEYEQQGVGYYERRYTPTGEWNDDSYANVDQWEGSVPKDRVKRVIDTSIQAPDRTGQLPRPQKSGA